MTKKEEFIRNASYLGGIVTLLLAAILTLYLGLTIAGLEIDDPLGIYDSFISIWGINIIVVIIFLWLIGFKFFYPKDIKDRILPELLFMATILSACAVITGLLGDTSKIPMLLGNNLKVFFGESTAWVIVIGSTTLIAMIVLAPNVLATIGANINVYLRFRSKTLPSLQNAVQTFDPSKIKLPKYEPKIREPKPKADAKPKEPSPFERLRQSLPPLVNHHGNLQEIDLNELITANKKLHEAAQSKVIRVKQPAANITVPAVVTPEMETELKKKPTVVPFNELNPVVDEVLVQKSVELKQKQVVPVKDNIPVVKPSRVDDYDTFNHKPFVDDNIMNALTSKSNVVLQRPKHEIAGFFYDLGIRVSDSDITTMDGLRITRHIFMPNTDLKSFQKIQAALALKLKVKSLNLNFTENGDGQFCLDVLKPEDQWKQVLYGQVQNKFPSTNNHVPNILFGVDSMGEVLSMSLSKYPHLLVLGTTGSGKSNLINAMTLSLLEKNSPSVINMFLLDSKHSGDIYNGVPHIKGIAHTFSDVVKVFDFVSAEFNKRVNAFKHKDIEDINATRREKNLPNIPYIIIRIEELQSVLNKDITLASVGVNMETAEGKKQAEPFLEQIGKFKTTLTLLLTQGRQYGMFLWGATQFANISAIGKEIASQTFKIGMRMGMTDTNTAFGNTTSYPCHTLNGGEFIYDDGSIKRGVVTYLGKDKASTARELERRLQILKPKK